MTVISRTLSPTFVSVLKQLAAAGGMPGSFWTLDETSGNYIDQVSSIAGNPHGLTRGVPGLLPGGGGDSNDLAAQTASGAQYVDFGLNYGFANAAPFSFAVVVNLALVDATSRRIVSAEPTYNQGWVLVYWNTALQFIRGNAAGHDTAGTSQPIAGSTYLLVGAYDGANMTFYVNGSLVRTTASARLLPAQSTPLCLGRYYPDSTDYAPGTYDCFAICQYGLNASQVAALWSAYQLRQAATRKAAVTRVQSKSQAQALSVAPETTTRAVAPSFLSLLRQFASSLRVPGSLWTLDETAGNYLDQVSSVAGTPHGLTRGVAGLLPGGGGDSNDKGAQSTVLTDHVDFGLNYGFAGLAPFSFVLTFKPSLVDSTWRRIISTEPTYNQAWTLVSHASEIKFLRGDASGADGPTGPPLVPGQTYLIIGTYDGAQMSLYVNGRLIPQLDPQGVGYWDSGVPSVPSVRALPAQTTPLYLGNYYPDATPYAGGVYDCLAVCQDALTADQAAELWTAYQLRQAVAITAARTAQLARSQSQLAAVSTQVRRAIALSAAQAIHLQQAAMRIVALTQPGAPTVLTVPNDKLIAAAQAATVSRSEQQAGRFAVAAPQTITLAGVAARELLAAQHQAPALASMATRQCVVTQLAAGLRSTAALATTLVVSQPNAATAPGVIARRIVSFTSQTQAAGIAGQPARRFMAAQAAVLRRAAIPGRTRTVSQPQSSRTQRQVRVGFELTQAQTAGARDRPARIVFVVAAQVPGRGGDTSRQLLLRQSALATRGGLLAVTLLVSQAQMVVPLGPRMSVTSTEFALTMALLVDHALGVASLEDDAATVAVTDTFVD